MRKLPKAAAAAAILGIFSLIGTGTASAQGMDGSHGRTTVGEGITNFNLGDRVQAMASGGAFSEYSVAPAAKAFRIPYYRLYLRATWN